jgi:glycosyltransferase involved in cell wall biosynthesis
MQRYHHNRGTWRDKVTLYVALTDFAREKVVRLGLPADRVVVKPNFVAAPTSPRHTVGAEALFVGRLSVEKGVDCALDAFARMEGRAFSIVGNGPLEEQIRKRAAGILGVKLHGALPAESVIERMLQCSFLVFPSIWYEMFPRVLIEAMACGVPVLASRIGGLPEIVQDGVTGLLFEPGNDRDLEEKARRLFEDRDLNARLGAQARSQCERLYSPEVNLSRLLEIYRIALEAKGRNAGQRG